MASRKVTIVAMDIASLGGGMEVQLGTLATDLLKRGVRVTIIARRCALPAHPQLTVHLVRTPRRPFPLAYPLFAIGGSWALRRHRSGIVHCTGAIVTQAVDCTTVHFCHAAYRARGLGPRPGSPGRLARLSAQTSSLMAILAEKWCYRPSRVRSVIAVSPGVSDEVRRHFPALSDRVEVIPHGVDTERFRPDPCARRAVRDRHGIGADDPVAVFVGGDWRRKGLDHAIDAVAQTERWRLLVVGHGHRPSYEERVRDLGLGGRVLFAGETEDVPGYLAASDVFCLPTQYETFCLVAFEAAAAGLPVLVTHVSGPDMLIEPGVNGDFLDDDIGRTARLLDGYLDVERRERHGEAARMCAGSFTWDRATTAHEALYATLAGAADQSSI